MYADRVIEKQADREGPKMSTRGMEGVIAPSPEGPLFSAMRTLEKRVIQSRKILEELHNKMMPILSETYPQESTTRPDRDQAGTSSMACTLTEMANELEAQFEYVDSLIGRIEL